MLEAMVKQQFQCHRDNRTVHSLLFIMDGPELVKQTRSDQWRAKVEIHVFRSGKTMISITTDDAPVIRPKTGILAGVKIVDSMQRKQSGTSWTSIAGELSFHWLNQQYSGRLRLPNFSKSVGNQEYDSCLNCRWVKMVRMGSDEMEMDLSDEDGLNLREFSRGSRGPAIEPKFQCTLFAIWLEETFGILDELNVMAEGGMVNSSLINLTAGWGIERWQSLEYVRQSMLSSRACLFHRQNRRIVGSVMNEATTICTNFPGKGGGEKKGIWIDRVPPGWMPADADGIIGPGKVSVWLESVPRTVLDHREETMIYVQQSMQTKQKQLPSGNGSVPAGEQTPSITNILSQF